MPGRSVPTSVTDDPERLLEPLDPEQRRVATALDGPVCVLAGAGTGKTRALTHRVAYAVASGAFDASGVLAVTFTTRAAAEMRARLVRLGVPGVSTRTFHSAALSQMRYLWPRLFGASFPEVSDAPDLVVRDLAAAAGLSAGVRDLMTEISWCKVSNTAPEEYVPRAVDEGRRLSGATPSQVARLYRAYVDALARAGRVDLDDVLLAAVGALETQPEAARAVRRRYRWFVVDEFQDVSGLQHRLLECWLGDRDDVCVVGDPRQAIYGFAGARADYLTRFPARFPGTTLVRLHRNYRSAPEVLAAAGAVVEDVGPAPSLTPTLPSHGRTVTLVEAATEAAEADEVASRVHQLVQAGTSERDVAVLVRSHAQVPPLVRALQQRGVRVAARTGTPFYERPEVRQAVALVAAAARRADGPGVPRGTAGEQPADREVVAEVRAVLGEAGWSAERPVSAVERARWEAWAAVVEVVEDLVQATTAGTEVTLATVVDHLREQTRAGAQPRGSGVTVATLHATKGQEWSAVFVAGAHDGGLPSAAAVPRLVDGPAMDEERRLLYVGMTRARDALVVSWAVRRTGSESRPRRPSRFLHPLLERPGPQLRVDRLRPT